MANIKVWTEKGSSRRKEFSSAVSSNKQLEGFNPLMSINPYGENEYQYFQDAWANTRAGEALDILIDFAFGRGVKPTIQLLNEKQMTPTQRESAMNEFQYVIDKLLELDNQEGVQFSDKLKSGATLAKVFGRCALPFEYGANNLPDAIKIYHSRDLGLVRLKEHDWTVSSVIVLNGVAREKTLVGIEDMLYIVNKENNPVRRNIGYGFSEMQRPIGAARAMRRFVEYDSPEILTSLWAGYGMFTVRPQSKNPTTDLNNILGGLKAGGFNAISANPEDIKYEQLKLEADTQKLVQLMQFFDMITVSNFKVPSALMGREEDQNMATLFGKIQLFVNGPVMEVRNWIAPYAEKWYNMNLDKIDKNLKRKIKIKAEFEPLIIESWKDTVEAVANLKSKIFPNLPDAVALRLLNLSQFEDELQKADEEAEKESEEKGEEQVETEKESESAPEEETSPGKPKAMQASKKKMKK